MQRAGDACGKRRDDGIALFFPLWGIWTAAYLYLICPQLTKPFNGWEFSVWEDALRVSSFGVNQIAYFQLPPLLEPLIAFSLRFFGASEFSARLIGALSFIVILPLIYYISGKIAPREKRLQVTLLTGILLLASPSLVQGSLLITKPDTTLFPVMLLLFYGAFFATEKATPLRRFFIISILFAALLWTKMTTALACVVALPLGCFLVRISKREIFTVIAYLIGGGLIFLAGWAVVIAVGPGIGRFGEPFLYCFGDASRSYFRCNLLGLAKIALDLIRVTLWISPLFMLLSLSAIYRAIRNCKVSDSARRECHLIAFVIVLFAGYGLTNMTFASFPKYVIPGIPLLAVIVARHISSLLADIDRRKILYIAALLVSGIWYYYLVVGDSVYAIHILRQAELNDTLYSGIGTILRQQALYFLFPLALIVLLRAKRNAAWQKSVIISLAVGFISSGAALALIQRDASYATQYGYGCVGDKMVYAYLHKLRPQTCLASNEGLVFSVPGTVFGVILEDEWNSPDKFLARIKQQQPQCIIYGLEFNSIRQLKTTMQDGRVQAYLKEFYRDIVCGDSHLLLKRDKASLQ